ncbi:protein-glutamine gamma-glutamyltransferase [Priestia megaterium]|jgi:protein-glutamine gamma-glutamyltransferase|uniref:Protein-glutamine gamma-glutamyltransferase n=1 Tax=Priestia megaterium TaxID=1404 RepID=A0A6H1P368_PRIMG|nr:protein-glutamine gamma-glutamyltransferase [Priestia megaterium]QIZ08034.1 protein-glutamine gamma-glutamyltransferase [Priestia megaterium]
MIKINQQTIHVDDLSHTLTTKEQKDIVTKMEKYREIYQYQTLSQFKFELLFRTKTLQAARELNKSKVQFTTFTYAFCNKRYWDRLSNGGFLLKPNVRPSVAILDVLKNGAQYAFDCSTGIAIVLYLATLYSIGSTRFDLLFNRLLLMDWQFDNDLKIWQKYGDDFIPGDILHFNNPDVNPKESHWRAENVIFMADDQYYGHGVGIKKADTIITFLNKKRKPNPRITPYLMNLITRPVYLTFL